MWYVCTLALGHEHPILCIWVHNNLIISPTNICLGVLTLLHIYTVVLWKKTIYSLITYICTADIFGAIKIPHNGYV